MTVLEVKGLNKSFGGLKAVDDLSFSIEEGDLKAIIGPNGAGKTTVFNLITGFLRPDSGNIYLRNADITRWPPHRIAQAGAGRTFQKLSLFPSLTVLDNLLLGFPYGAAEGLWSCFVHPQSLRTAEREFREKATGLLELVGLEEKREALARELSYGERKLLEIARCLATGASIILLDEPTSGLFSKMIHRLLETIQRLNSQGKTIIFIEHNLKAVLDLAREVIVMANGRKLAEGPPKKIHYDERVIEAYMGEKAAATPWRK